MPATKVQQVVEARGIDFQDLEVVCPAGTRCALPLGVECRIEDSFVSASHQPSSLASYCMGNYTACPTWRTNKEHRWAQKRAIDMNHEPRSRRTLLDQDPETIPTYLLPRDGGPPEQL